MTLEQELKEVQIQGSTLELNHAIEREELAKKQIAELRVIQDKATELNLALLKQQLEKGTN